MTGSDWFWTIKPAGILTMGAAVALTASTLISMFWPESKPDGIFTRGLCVGGPYTLWLYVWIWSLLWWLIADAAKVYTSRLAEHYNLFGMNDTGVLVLPPAAIALQKSMVLGLGEGKAVAKH